MYGGGHPNKLARILNKGGEIFHLLGILPAYSVTLEVVGRRSGKESPVFKLEGIN
jgi:hypothetical protein